ncbi:OLC1v1008489C1 [Oldenlandia corymbosa var. corymbosa]|nr:OLC1v1008489C1 [Oldenlandia corymbosa var. corymbosa]
MLKLRDLVNAIAGMFEGRLFEGRELYGMKNNQPSLCRIIKIYEDDSEMRFEVAWLNKDRKVTENEVIDEEVFISKLPFTRGVLKSFIRESTYRNGPWVLHENVARKHGISTEPPDVMKGMVSFRNGLVVCSKKRKNVENHHDDQGKGSKCMDGTLSENANEDGKRLKKQLKYPVDDLLVDLAEDDQNLRERPIPCRDFEIPMDCVGDLLMVWDFCTSFGALLHLSPFSLEDFEGALCHKDSNVVLIMECHSALLRLLMKASGKFSLSIQNRKRKPKITLITWTEYLCDFMEISDILDSTSHITTIKRGHYGLLDVNVKLGILKELVAEGLETDLLREKLDENYDELQAFAAIKRGDAIEEGRERREKKESLKSKSDGKNMSVSPEIVKGSSTNHIGGNLTEENGNVLKTSSNKAVIPPQKRVSGNSEDEQAETTGSSYIKKQANNQGTDEEVILNNANDTSKRKIHKLMKADIRKTIQKKSKEQRKEYLEREMEKRFIRHTALGKDRDYNRYWFFRRDGRVFVENSDSTLWGYYSSKEEVDALLASLNVKGVRELALKKQLQKHHEKICFELQKRSKEIALKIAMEEAVLRRSTRVRAPSKDNPALAFLKYENKWKED